MHLSRRELVRRLAGLATAASLWASTVFVLNDDIPSVVAGRHASNNGRRNSGTAPGRDGQSTTSDTTTETSSQQQSNTTEQQQTSTTGTTTTEASDQTTTTHNHDHDSTTSPPVTASLELAGDVGPALVPSGSTARIVGNVNLRGDLVVEGTLTGIDTFKLSGNGHQILVQKGGRLDLRGKAKTGWIRGGSPSGWQSGDRVGTAPIAVGAFGLGDFQIGSWPVGGPGSVQLIDGRTLKAEQFNLTRSIVIDNVSRIMIHDGAGVQTLKHIAITNSGVAGKLAFYPLHFHMNGNSTKGSLVEGVVIEGGKFHAFVPHASHGITMRDCVAFNTSDTAFWWDPPPDKFDASNNSDNVTWQHCLAAYVTPGLGEDGVTVAGFMLQAGSGNKCVDSTAVGVQGRKNASGFRWPSQANQNTGGNVWNFVDNVAHNNRAHGIFVWQNDPGKHHIQRFVAYRCGDSGIDHGAYVNTYTYEGVVLQEMGVASVQSHAVASRHGPLRFIDLTSDSPLIIQRHSASGPVDYVRLRVPRVIVNEKDKDPSTQRFHDCSLTPDHFQIDAVRPDSVIELYEGGVLTSRWAGSWATA